MLTLAALIFLDLSFIGLHLVHVHTDLLPSTRWSIERDRGFAEVFQYLKFAGVGLALAQLYRQTRMAVLPGWIAVFVLLLIDDAARLHEQFGLGVVAWGSVPDIGLLRGRDLGELLYAALMFLIVAPVLAYGYRHGSLRARAMSCDLAVLLVALVACGVGGDVLHRLLSATSLNTVAGVLEDGGELVVLSVTCFYVMQWRAPDVALGRRNPAVRPGARLFAWANRIAGWSGRSRRQHERRHCSDAQPRSARIQSKG